MSDRFRGALVGLAVGDAVGTTVEFRSPGTFPPVTDMVGGGPFSLRPGQWTDDTSMALCLADSLIACGKFDASDQLDRYLRWYRDGERSSTGRCFDIGIATRSALESFERTGDPAPAPDSAGNGPLMKLAPIPMAFADRALAVDYAARSSRTTHGAPQADDASRVFADFLWAALRGEDWGRFDGELHHEVRTVVDGSYKRKQPPEIMGHGYIVLALEAALWAVDRGTSFEDVILRAVNLGDDADTTAAIAGQLAGALYGYDGIPAHWLERVYLHDELVALADQLEALALTR